MTPEIVTGLGLIGARLLHDLALMLLFGIPAFGLYAQPVRSAASAGWIRNAVLWAGVLLAMLRYA